MKIDFILSQFMKVPAIDDTFCFIDIVDKCLKDFSLKAPPPEELVAPPTPELMDHKDDLLLDKGLEEFITFTSDLMLDIEHLKVELNELPDSLRYVFLDIELNLPVIVNANLGR